jgi:hypothetical protein
MAFSTVAKNESLDGIPMDRVSLHSADPGTDGSNIIAGGGKQVAVFDPAAGGVRALNADVVFSGLGALQPVTHYGVWLNAGDVYKYGSAITVGDLAANAAGEYTLRGITTTVVAS